VRLVQSILQKQYLTSITRGGSNANNAAAVPTGGASQGWRGFDEAVKHARGATFDEVQKGEDKAVKARALLTGSGEKKIVFVVFLGGITFTEIAALRFIAKQEEGKFGQSHSNSYANNPTPARKRIIICTTSIISGNRMMDVAIETGSLGKNTAQVA
jgi:hypothetical protein